MDVWIAERLLTGSVQGAAIIALVWLVCRRCPGIPPTVQAALWWLASLKLVLALAPIPAVALPLLPAPVPGPVPVAGAGLNAARLVMGAATSAPATPKWISLLVLLWAAGVLLQAVLLWRSFRGLRQLVARATPLPPADAALAFDVARAVGLGRTPDVRHSEEVIAPLVVGVRRPVVLVPATLGDDERAMALCHEFVHVRRHDLALGWIPALAERLFFFHPLARLVAREYITAREAACDAGVVRALGVSPGDYGRLLVRLGIARSQPVTAGSAPASMASLRRRLAMLQHRSLHARSSYLSWLIAAALVLALVPFELSARNTQPVAVPRAPELTVVAAVREPASPVPAVAALAAQSNPTPVPAGKSPQATAPANPTPAPDGPTTVAAPEELVGAIPPELRSVLEMMRVLDARMRTERAQEAEYRAQEAAYRQAVAEYNRLAEQANQLAGQTEAEIRARRAYEQAISQQQSQQQNDAANVARELERLRAQLEVMMKQLQTVAEQQRQLAEIQRALARETERLGNKLQSR